ncbi:MAG: class E sortase [Actinomycetota bacterium]
MVLRGIGRVFITVGLLVLMFLGYQLYGTNAVTGKHQEALAADLQKSWELSPGSAGAAPGTGGAMPDPGQGIAVMQIPKIAVDSVIVEGTEVNDLKKGPGHYRDTAFPGQLGNVVISGHRTTYGAPFYRLDELKKDDEIIMKDSSGTYKYTVIESKIVAPTDLSVVVPSTDARLTLTTCHPRFSARQRLIIVAALQGTPRQ